MRIRSFAAVAAFAVAASAVAPAAAAPAGHPDNSGQRAKHGVTTFTFGVIGDTPYGDAKIARFPADVDKLNADKSLQALIHVGDIKSGSTKCTDEYNTWVKSQFDRFTMPFVYTPGDNEWTDCHRANNGSYNPIERLSAVRNTFFANPGHTLGADAAVTDQTDRGVPENVRSVQGNLSMATIHVVGSNDGLAPWTGATKPNTAQIADEKVRMNAAIENVRAAFRDAKANKSDAVVIFQQADMFDGTYDGWKLEENDAFLPLIKVLTEESNRFKGATYLFDGDSHVFNDDRPLAKGSPWIARYGLKTTAPKVHRITVSGSGDANEYLRVTAKDVRPGNQNVLSVKRVSLVG